MNDADNDADLAPEKMKFEPKVSAFTAGQVGGQYSKFKNWRFPL